jgi:hypothetical protein
MPRHSVDVIGSTGLEFTESCDQDRQIAISSENNMKMESKYLAMLPIQMALGFELSALPTQAFGRLVNSFPVSYRYIDIQTLKSLEKNGIPARGPLPFAANWLEILARLRKDNPHAVSWVATLVYCEWGFMYWVNTTEKVNIASELRGKHAIHTFLKKEGLVSKGDLNIGVSARDLACKWWLDDLALKIRAVWDKLPHAIAETSLPKIELKAESHGKRVNELVQHKQGLGLWAGAEPLFDVLVKEMRDIDYIKKYRDAELHRHTAAYAEVFGLYRENESLDIVWSKLGEELNRCREALMATIAMVVLREKPVAT